MRNHESTARLFEYAMQELHLNPSELSRRLGRSTSSVSRYVHGQTAAPSTVLKDLAQLCGFATLRAFYHAAL